MKPKLFKLTLTSLEIYQKKVSQIIIAQNNCLFLLESFIITFIYFIIPIIIFINSFFFNAFLSSYSFDNYVLIILKKFEFLFIIKLNKTQFQRIFIYIFLFKNI